MLSPGRYLEKQRRRIEPQSISGHATNLSARLISAGAPDDHLLQYRVETMIELAESDLVPLIPAIAPVYCRENLQANPETYFQLLQWFDEPTWTDPPIICRTCGCDPDPDLSDGLCDRCHSRIRTTAKVVQFLTKRGAVLPFNERKLLT